MSMPSAQVRSEVFGGDNLIRVRPQNATGSGGAPFGYRQGNVIQQPRKIPRLRNTPTCGGAKPAHTAELGLPLRPILQALWGVQMGVKPIKHAPHFMHLPQIPQVRAVIPNIESGAENALVTSCVRIPDVRFKSDIHVEHLRRAQTFLRRLKTNFGRAEHAMRFRSGFSRWSLRRKTYQPQVNGQMSAGSMSKARLEKPGVWKHFVERMETAI